MTEFGITIGAPLGSGWEGPPVADFLVDSDETLIKFTTERGIGHGVLQVGGDVVMSNGPYQTQVEPMYLSEVPAIYGPFRDVTVYANMQEIWRGHMTRPTYDVYGNIVGFDAKGYFTRLDQPYKSDTTGSTSALELIRDYRARYASWLSEGPPGYFQASQTSVGREEFDGMTGSEMFDALSTIGGEGGIPYDIEVWGTELWARNRHPPSIAQYNPPLDGRNEPPNVDWENLYGRVQVRYITPIDEPKATDWIEDATFRDRYGVMIERAIAGGVMEDGTAELVSQAFLEQHRTPRLSFQFNRRNGDGLERMDGGIMPSHLVRAGEWVEILGQGLFQIVRTDCNVTTGDATFDVGQHHPDFDQLLSRLQHDAQAIRTWINPVTGAKEYLDFDP